MKAFLKFEVSATRSCKRVTAKCSLQFVVSHEKSDAKGIYLISGSFSARTLEKVVNMNKDAIENVTSADLQGVDVIIPSLQPGISSSEVSKRRAGGLPFSQSLLSYALIASCVSVVLILMAIAFWKFR